MDVKQCLRWLESIHLLGKWAKIEGVCPSHSTLMIVSMPVSLWDMLPDHPACNFIGYVTGPNMISGVPFGDRELASLVGNLPTLVVAPGYGTTAVFRQLHQLGTFFDRGNFESVDSSSTPAANPRENTQQVFEDSTLPTLADSKELRLRSNSRPPLTN
jgi:hypothetical protein